MTDIHPHSIRIEKSVQFDVDVFSDITVVDKRLIYRTIDICAFIQDFPNLEKIDYDQFKETLGCLASYFYLDDIDQVFSTSRENNRYWFDDLLIVRKDANKNIDFQHIDRSKLYACCVSTHMLYDFGGNLISTPLEIDYMTGSLHDGNYDLKDSLEKLHVISKNFPDLFKHLSFGTLELIPYYIRTEFQGEHIQVKLLFHQEYFSKYLNEVFGESNGYAENTYAQNVGFKYFDYDTLLRYIIDRVLKFTKR